MNTSGTHFVPMGRSERRLSRVSKKLVPVSFFKQCHGDTALLRQRFAQRFDSLELVHGTRGEVRLAATRARPHRNALDHKKIFARAKGTTDQLQLYLDACAVSASAFSSSKR